jgi:hypothetical protein
VKKVYDINANYEDCDIARVNQGYLKPGKVIREIKDVPESSSSEIANETQKRYEVQFGDNIMTVSWNELK